MKKAKQKPFSRMSKADKRVAIAKDALKQIQSVGYDIKSGTWLDISIQEVEEEPGDSQEYSPEESQALLLGKALPKVVQAQRVSCTCCAIGAACASTVRLFNTHKINKDGYLFEGLDEGFGILKAYFSARQVSLIEAAFECRDDGDWMSLQSDHLKDSDKDRITKFCDERLRYDDTARAIAIFRNIIRNKGEFVI